MKIYTIYKHTILKTNKSYIGFTNQTMEKRLSKHIQNASDGISTKFYNAFRKYCFYNGVYNKDSISSEILCTCKNQEMAYELEEKMIKLHNSYEIGYNSTPKGGGGWIVGYLTKDKQDEYIEKRKKITSGENNPNHSGYTDEDIVDFACKYYKNKGIFVKRKWRLFCKQKGYPQTYSKCRFKGEGFSGLINLMCEKLNVKNLKTYIKTENHKKKLSNANKKNRWICNIKTLETKQIKGKDYYKYDHNVWTLGKRVIKNKIKK